LTAKKASTNLPIREKMPTEETKANFIT